MFIKKKKAKYFVAFFIYTSLYCKENDKTKKIDRYISACTMTKIQIQPI